MKSNRGFHTHLLHIVVCIASNLIGYMNCSTFALPALLSERNPSVSSPAGGNDHSVAPYLSPDGRYAVFCSSASDLVTNDNGRIHVDVFLRDCLGNRTELVSARYDGRGGGNDNSMCGVVSTNGRYVLFLSDASDLVQGDTNGLTDVFVRDMVLQTNILVSAGMHGASANGATTDASMSPDGRYVVFVSTRRGKSELFTMNSDGSDQLPIEGIKGSSFTPHWSN